MPSPSTTIQRRDIGDVVSEYALERSRDSFVGLKLMPVFNTNLQSGNYPIISVEEMLKPRDTKRAPRGAYNRGDWQFTQGNYACKEYGWEEVVDQVLARNYSSYFDAEMVAGKIATDVLLRAQEVRIKAVAEASTAHASSVKWSTAATATPKKDVNAGIKTIQQATGLLPNVMVMTWQTFQNLLVTSELAEATKYTGNITTKGIEAQKAMIAMYFGVSEVVISNGVQNGNKEGSSSGFSASQIWADAYAFLAVTSGASLESGPSYGRSFLWTDDSPNNVNVESYYEDNVRGTVIRCRQYIVEKELNTSCIYMLSNLA